MKHLCKIASPLFAAVVGAGIPVYRLNYQIPLGQYTANALYLGVLDGVKGFDTFPT